MLGVRVPPVLPGEFMFNKIAKYFKETKLELAKVAWPSRIELRDSTIVVIILSVLLSVFIGVVDYALSKASTFIFR
jgi:preprotein translocase subunit SecE